MPRDNPLGVLVSLDRLYLLSISYVTYSVIEESIFVPLKPKLFKLLLAADDLANRDKALNRKISGKFRNMTQEDWGIPQKNRSALAGKGYRGAEKYR